MQNNVDIEMEFEAKIKVMVMGEGAQNPGTFYVDRCATYGEIFTLAAVEDTGNFVLQDTISFADAFLVGNEFYIILVV